VGEEEWLATRDVFMSGWLTQGPKGKEFESKFAQFHGANFGIATTSCTTGLHLALEAMGIGEGDEVIVPAFTWVSTANAVLYTGAKPIFADVSLKTNNIDVEGLKNLRTAKTKAIIPVHLFGLCADVDAIKAELPGVKILEDCACAAGAKYKGRFAGTLGDVGAFSTHPRKSITTGEGGVLTTNSLGLAEKMDCLRNHGSSVSEEQRHVGPKPYLLADFNEIGFNYRMTDFQGAIGTVQLSKLDQFINERSKWANYYSEAFSDISWLITPEVPDGWRHAWQAYVCYVDPAKSPIPRNELMEILQQKGISTRPGTHAVHNLGIYKKLYGFNSQSFPNAYLCDQQTLAIPLHNRMSKEDFDYVIQAIKEIS
ncbi:MAG: perosamine synthetase, partial [Bdellovibrionales bacterium CG22_combo_CG10-13_8_21_14_all_38_13]